MTHPTSHGAEVLRLRALLAVVCLERDDLARRLDNLLDEPSPAVAG